MDVSGTIDAILGQKGTEIFSVSPDATVFEAVEIMANKNVGALLVIKDGTLVGMISERDYTRKVMLRGKRSRETQVHEIMSSDLTVVTSREPVENCLRMLAEVQREKGGLLTISERLRAIRSGSSEVTKPSLFGTLIIAVVYLPVLTLTGVEGKLRGIISIGDLVKCVIANQSAAIAHLESYISGGYCG